MSNDLDNILSGNSTAAPEANEQEQVTQAGGESQQQIEGSTQEEQPAGQSKMVPHEALHAEKQKVKRYTDEVADFRRSNESLQRQVTELLQRIPVPKVETPQAPDFFENPSEATQHEVQRTVSPQFEQINQTLLAIARDNAETRFTPESVDEAEKAFIGALQSGAIKPNDAEYQKVVTSPNRYAAAVQWHKRQLAQKEIGDDPAAFRTKLEAELRERITAELQGEQQPAAQQQQRVMPSNLAGARNVGARNGPAWSGPSDINDIFNRARSSG